MIEKIKSVLDESNERLFSIGEELKTTPLADQLELKIQQYKFITRKELCMELLRHKLKEMDNANS